MSGSCCTVSEKLNGCMWENLIDGQQKRLLLICYWNYLPSLGDRGEEILRHLTLTKPTSWSPTARPLYCFMACILDARGCLDFFKVTSCTQCVVSKSRRKPVTLHYSCSRDQWKVNLACPDLELTAVLLKDTSLLLLMHWTQINFFHTLGAIFKI